ncbi:MarR family winged helix-turn-helix transcriptional regulator [Microscilla marina]|uniref:Transcriptional regulator, MarR family, putative n=1 Tax=Microscilla marina ATCC 23134 TaxID=313606 RepID=A1ZC99_MICM2|nr:MarR family transcriptional regulator [Microscilla marina]EAY31901.1 transcriptional regulator, MarR family, putative [Microscilla marina ATCC 23134]
MRKETVEESLVLTIIELAAQMTKKGDVLTQELGITTQQWLILLYIYGDPNIPFLNSQRMKEGVFAKDIAEALDVSKPNIANLVNILSQKDLITQIEDPIDRRRKRLKITEKGIGVISQMEQKRVDANQVMFGSLDQNERLEMLQLLHACLRKLKRKE